MGPRSENRGYFRHYRRTANRTLKLQWVHGPRTVVIFPLYGDLVELRLASMGPRSENRGYSGPAQGYQRGAAQASMGPRSENRGYLGLWWGTHPAEKGLQWVHGPRTVVIFGQLPRFIQSLLFRFNGSTVREPWLFKSTWSSSSIRSSFNGSTVREPWLLLCEAVGIEVPYIASMGPRSENRGYLVSFTGVVTDGSALQWVHGPRTVVIDDRIRWPW